MSHTITLIPGDGIGPEVVQSAKRIIDEVGLNITWETCEAGTEVFKKGLKTGVPKETIDSLKRNKIALKGPLETPVGYGEKSANVTLRKMFETYANIRPVFEIQGVKTPYTGQNIDMVIVRENVEDLYAGIEHMQSPTVAQCLKWISRKGCEKIIRFAFEYAISFGRKKVTCATKANIMKLTEGLFKKTFEDIAKEYPHIESNHVIIDNCAHMMVKKPTIFDVIVTTNMNGDIISDLASGLVGGLGLAPGANIGANMAIFEAVHGSAPEIAGKNIANPTAVIFSSVMMLRHIGEFEAADVIEQAVKLTLQNEQSLTADLAANNGLSTIAFTDAILKNLGKTTPHFQKRAYTKLSLLQQTVPTENMQTNQQITEGVDLFLQTHTAPSMLGEHIEKLIANTAFTLKIITCRGVKVYPVSDIEADLVDVQQCRFVLKNSNITITHNMIVELIQIIQQHYQWSHIEKLYRIDGQPAYTKAHGEE